MGLLDDAIREHMELKRLRGADPGVLAREEQDVLGRVPRRGDPEEPAGEGVSADRQEIAGEDLDGLARVDSPEPPRPARGPDFANVGQETAELDMRTVLDEHHEAGETAGHIHPESPSGAPGEEESVDASVEDVLEETPDFLRDTPEQERLWFEQQPPRDFDFDK